MRVLILEDDANLATLWNDSLESCGFTCSVYTTCESALRATLYGSHDLYLLDYYVHDGSTGPLTALIRARYPGRPIVMITGSDEYARGEHASGAHGPHWVLRKPVMPSDLQHMAQYLLGRVPGTSRAAGAA